MFYDNELVNGISFDFGEAFKIVSHSILLSKLYSVEVIFFIGLKAIIFTGQRKLKTTVGSCWKKFLWRSPGKCVRSFFISYYISDKEFLETVQSLVMMAICVSEAKTVLQIMETLNFIKLP